MQTSWLTVQAKTQLPTYADNLTLDRCDSHEVLVGWDEALSVDLPRWLQCQSHQTTLKYSCHHR
jgi:hypothetical protein